MATFDDAYSVLKTIAQEFADFCKAHGAASETDTRVKVIDRVLKEVCAWPESRLSREDHGASGFSDYRLIVRDRPLIVVEAKREGETFTVPVSLRRKTMRLDGSLLTDASVKYAVEQVQQYCVDAGIRFAVATNGYAWIVFRAVRDDIPWRSGSARVFPSLDYIIEHFTDFWNLLSYDALATGSLDVEFGARPASSRNMHRVVNKIPNSDAPLFRNKLNNQLHPFIRSIFDDIASQDDADLFQSCYIYDAHLSVVARDIDVVITDAIPRFIQDEGGEEILQSKASAGNFEAALSASMDHEQGELYLLFGGIGSGKTTFLKRYQRLLHAKTLNERSYWFHVDFLGPPPDSRRMPDFVWAQILAKLRREYASEFLETRRIVKKLFADKIRALSETVLRQLNPDGEAFEAALSPYLDKWQADSADYLSRLLRYAKRTRGKAVILFVDNMDQLDPEYQRQIFLFAQQITRSLDTTTIIAMREESYYSATVQQTFTAYSTRKFHIASPRFLRMIGSRLGYAIDQMTRSPDEVTITALRGQVFDRTDIGEFLLIVQESIFKWSRMLPRFIEAICFGNMRMALEMFSTFLTSGASDVNKMLHLYRRDGEYHVAFHEFLKAIMLGERRYYKEEFSRIINIFNCTSERNSSHFTAWRVITLLLHHRGETNPEGMGYFELGRLIGAFESVFDNTKDLLIVMDRLLGAQLIEVNSRSTKTIANASHVRVTSAGWYYVRHLTHKFAYLDLVLQDTPIDEREVENSLRQSVYEVDNFGDRDDNRLERVRARFDRVEVFVDYLKRQEEEERAYYDLQNAGPIISRPIMAWLLGHFKHEREYIEHKLIQNRQRFMEDAPEMAAGETDDQFGAIDR